VNRPRYGNRTGYIGKEEKGSESCPMGRGKENQKQTTTPACITCGGWGLLDSGAPVSWPHIGTLEAVRYLMRDRGARYCVCAVGAGWRALMDDAAKGDGSRKGMGQGGKTK